MGHLNPMWSHSWKLHEYWIFSWQLFPSEGICHGTSHLNDAISSSSVQKTRCNAATNSMWNAQLYILHINLMVCIAPTKIHSLALFWYNFVLSIDFYFKTFRFQLIHHFLLSSYHQKYIIWQIVNFRNGTPNRKFLVEERVVSLPSHAHSTPKCNYSSSNMYEPILKNHTSRMAIRFVRP